MCLARAIRFGFYLDETLKIGQGSSVISDAAWGLRHILPLRFVHKNSCMVTLPLPLIQEEQRKNERYVLVIFNGEVSPLIV